jgi:hypothetical protein
MLRRKLRLRTDDLKELRVKLVPTWCTGRKHMAKAKSKLRRRRRRRMRVASCVDLLVIGQRSVQIAKEENLNLSRGL